MKYFKSILLLLTVTIFVSSCNKNQEARRPISRASGTFMKKSIERNKKIVAGEEGQIDSLINSNPKIKYIATNKGYWYTYITENKIDTITPKKGDVAFYNYEIKDLKGKIIYSELELRPQTYSVDKQNIMTGIREGIKLMHKNEKVTFLFPSHIAYGFHGDEKKIGPNQPLMCTVTLNNFISEEALKKQIQLREDAKQNAIINNQKDSLTN
jgi:gliding motility-associated peptidyl-prolyl isomerase